MADLLPERAVARAAQFNIRRACSVEELLTDDEIEVILNLTVPAAHAGISLRALEVLGSCEERAEEFARIFADLSPAALVIAKKAFYSWDAFHFDKGLAKAEKVYMEELMKTDDSKEGINAFMQKRQPKWCGK